MRGPTDDNSKRPRQKSINTTDYPSDTGIQDLSRTPGLRPRESGISASVCSGVRARKPSSPV